MVLIVSWRSDSTLLCIGPAVILSYFLGGGGGGGWVTFILFEIMTIIII